MLQTEPTYFTNEWRDFKDDAPEASPSNSKKISILTSICGRDLETLRHCPSDEINESNALGVSMFTGVLIHGASMTATLSILNTDLPLAIVLSGVSAAGLFAVDRAIIRASDIANSERSIRRVKGTFLPALSTKWRLLAGGALRTIVSASTALALAGFVGVHFYKEDVKAVVEQKQIAIDKQYLPVAREKLRTERMALELTLDQVENAKTRLLDEFNNSVINRGQSIERAELEVEKIEKTLTELRNKIRLNQLEEKKQLGIAACELSGPAPGCDALTKPGPGRLWELANKRAEQANSNIKDIRVEVAKTEKSLSLVRDKLSNLYNQDTPKTDQDYDLLEQRERDALKALAQFDQLENQRIFDILSENPDRVVLNQDSLAEKIKALKVIAQDPWILLSILAVKFVALALELRALIMALMLVPSEYTLLRGRKLAALSRILSNKSFSESRQDERDKQEAADLGELSDEHFADWAKKIRNLKGEQRIEEIKAQLLKTKSLNELLEREKDRVQEKLTERENHA